MFAFTRFSLLTVFLLPIMGLYAQSPVEQAPFEGILSYKIEFEGAIAEELKLNEPNDEMRMTVAHGSYLVELTGGRYEKMFMFIADSNYEYSIDLETKRAFRFSSYSDRVQEGVKEEKPVAQPTGRKGTVRGYTCYEYKMVTEQAEFLYYVSKEHQVDLTAFPAKPRSKVMFLVPGLEGYVPIRIIKQAEGLKVTTTLADLQKRDLTVDNFTIPADFVVKGRDHRF